MLQGALIALRVTLFTLFLTGVAYPLVVTGLDPHLSLEGALWQVPRVAKARGVAPERLEAVIRTNAEERNLGFLGEPRINVLLLNLAIDRQFGRP